VLLHALLVPIVVLLGRLPWRVDIVPAQRRAGSFSLLATLDTLCTGLLWVTGFATFGYKTYNGRAAYLLAEMGQTSASQQYLEKSLALNPDLKAATFLRNKLIEERVALAHGTRTPRDANVATPASYQQ
jgi:hypothetical protein